MALHRSNENVLTMARLKRSGQLGNSGMFNLSRGRRRNGRRSTVRYVRFCAQLAAKIILSRPVRVKHEVCLQISHKFPFVFIDDTRIWVVAGRRHKTVIRSMERLAQGDAA
jgi:hypothetical protein